MTVTVRLYVVPGARRQDTVRDALSVANKLGLPVTFEWNDNIPWTVYPGGDPVESDKELVKMLNVIAFESHHDKRTR